MDDSAHDITMLLERGADDVATETELFELIKRRFYVMAQGLLRNERAGHSLQPTMLVDDAFIQLVRGRNQDWSSREEFFAHAAKVMRNLLVDRARAKLAAKRGAGERPVPLAQAGEAEANDQLQSLIEVNDILQRMERLHPDVFLVFDLHYFMGYELQEIAENILDVSYTTVRRRWKMARAFLHRELVEDA